MKGKRTSKYKSIIGEEKSNKFTNINLVSEVTEGKLIACNGSFIAASWNSTPGAVAILNTHFPSNVKFNCPVLKGHKNSVFDLEFSPLKDTLLATGSDDATVKLWDIPKEGLTQNINEDLLTYKGHNRRVSFVKFNPVAADVIASASTDYTLQVWNIVKGELYSKIEFGDIPTSLDWNPIGSLVGVTNKKKTINIFDPREKKSILVTQIYESPRSPKFTWVSENTFITTGFSKQNVKELKLWDVRKVKEDLKSEGEIQKVVMDNLLTVATPFYDHESKLLFTSAKGELTIKCYDLNDSIIYQNSDYKSKTPALSINMFERRVLDYNKCEIDRFLHYNNKKELNFISFCIARKNPEYEPDLYPPVSIPEAALTYDQWISGENKEPIKKQIHLLDNQYVSKPENYISSNDNTNKDNKNNIDTDALNKIKVIEEKVNEKQKIYDDLLKEKEDLDNKLKEIRKKKEEINDKLNAALKLKAKKDEQKQKEIKENEEKEEKEVEVEPKEEAKQEQNIIETSPKEEAKQEQNIIETSPKEEAKQEQNIIETSLKEEEKENEIKIESEEIEDQKDENKVEINEIHEEESKKEEIKIEENIVEENQEIKIEENVLEQKVEEQAQDQTIGEKNQDEIKDELNEGEIHIVEEKVDENNNAE